ncbi:MAG: hypothetical protein JSU63_13220 [Phycisphaerales bacterium]|nr:MAG: hypothetical protein JSU63_13220 [Phycisphaerales bacterium]
MHYMLCKNKVADYAKWRQVFDSHAKAHRESGLHLLHLLREMDDPNTIVFMFKVDDMDKVQAFINAPEAAEGAKQGGVIGQTEVTFLTD